MVKSELIKFVAHNAHISQRKSSEIVNLLFGEIKERAMSDKPVKITGFGVFFSKLKPRKQIYVPQIQERRVIDSRTSLAFKPSRQYWL